MPVPTVRVFVSSTSLDLRPERAAVAAAVQRLRETEFVGMKYSGSRPETIRRASLDEVDRSHVYVGVFATRYGPGITEEEYRRARARELPCFIYFKGGPSALPPDLQEDAATAARLNDLKDELRRAHTVGTFTNPDNLAAKVTADLHDWLFDKYLTPKLEATLSGSLSRPEAQVLLSAVRDVEALPPILLSRLQAAGYNVPIGGDVFWRDKVANVYNTATPTGSALHQLRMPVGDFVGRKETATLTAALRAGGAAAISGMGGIGKTELSLEVAYRLHDRYPDAHFFIDMRGTDEHPRDPREALADCIRAFHGPEQRLPEALDDLTKIYRAALDGRRALVLLDNAHDAAQVRPLLPPAGSALLVTSREPIPLPGMERLTLERLPRYKARELLTGIAPRIPPDVADQICYLCGYLPLAIRAAGSNLDITADLDPADYARQLGDERRRLQHIGTGGVDVSVEASITLSYNRLSPAAARVFRLLSVFPASFAAQAEEAVCEDPDHKHLSDLLRRNLVLYNPVIARYRLHDLTRLFADARMNEDERSAAQTRHAEHYLSVLGQIDGLYLQGNEALNRGLALFDLEWRNIQAGQSWAEKRSGEDDAAASLCMHYPDAGAYTLDLRQHPRDKIRWRETALAAARRLKNRDAEAAHLNNLGLAYFELGEVGRAIEFYEKALILDREIGDRRAESYILGNLCLAYEELGETRRAIEFYEQILVIAREMGDRYGEARTLSGLGSAYAALGEVRRAVEFHEQHLAVAREIGDRRSEARALGNLGTAYAALGEVGRAIEFHEQQLAVAREIDDRLGEGNALLNIGAALDKLGARAQAIAHAEAALEIYEQIESSNAEQARARIAEWRWQGQPVRSVEDVQGKPIRSVGDVQGERKRSVRDVRGRRKRSMGYRQGRRKKSVGERIRDWLFGSGLR